MVARISDWLELSFWQIAVRMLGAARPFSRGIQKVQQVVPEKTIGKIAANGWAVAAGGWVFGLIIGILISR